MLVIFATMVVDPSERDEVVATMSARLEQVAPAENGAVIFEFLMSATDPGRLHVFQAWESEEAFARWGNDETHRAVQAEFARWTKEVSAVQYVGCTPRGR